MPDTNRRRSSRQRRLLVRATGQIPVSASPHLGHPKAWSEGKRGQIVKVRTIRAAIRKQHQCITSGALSLVPDVSSANRSPSLVWAAVRQCRSWHLALCASSSRPHRDATGHDSMFESRCFCSDEVGSTSSALAACFAACAVAAAHVFAAVVVSVAGAAALPAAFCLR